MAAITFQLICRKNPQIVDVDDVLTMTKLDLDNSNIRLIDNLDLFTHILELNLSRNVIERIDNIESLTSLQILDLSYNRITGPALLESARRLPKSLDTIVLTGNPCTSDERSLSALQDIFPHLGIAIEEVEEETNSPEDDEDQGEDPDEVANTDAFSKPVGPLSSDEVLKYIVDRKCRLQNLHTFNLDATVKDLNDEAEKALDAVKQRRTCRPRSTPDLKSAPYEAQKEALLKRNAEQKSSFEDVILRMRTTAQEHFEVIKRRSADSTVEGKSQG